MTTRLDTRHRAEQAERTAAPGATWQEIADQLGYRSRQAASQAVKRLGNRTPPETVEQARAKLVGAFAPSQAVMDVNVSTDAGAIIDRMESGLLALVAQRQAQPALDGDVI